MEDYGYKYIQKLAQFVKTLNYRKNCLINLETETVEKSDVLWFF